MSTQGAIDSILPHLSAAIDCRNVVRAFKQRVVIQDLSFAVAPGKSMAVTGRNGVGKTTILRLLAGTLTPTAGSILIGGLPAGKGLSRYVPASDRLLYWRLTGRQNLEFSARLAGVSDRALEGSVAAAAKAVDAEDLLDRRVDTCSTGQRKRLMIGNALVTSAPLILLDEPIADLDPRGVEAVQDVLSRWVGAGGIVVTAAPTDEEAPPSDLRLPLDVEDVR